MLVDKVSLFSSGQGLQTQGQGRSNALSSGIPMANLFPSQMPMLNMQPLQQQVVLGNMPSMGASWYPIYSTPTGSTGLSSEQEANWGSRAAAVPVPFNQPVGIPSMAAGVPGDVQAPPQPAEQNDSSQNPSSNSAMSQGYPAMTQYPVGMGGFGVSMGGMGTWATQTYSVDPSNPIAAGQPSPFANQYSVIPASLQSTGQSPQGSPQLSPLTPMHIPPQYHLPGNNPLSSSPDGGGLFGSQQSTAQSNGDGNGGTSLAHQLQFGSMPIEESLNLTRPAGAASDVTGGSGLDGKSGDGKSRTSGGGASTGESTGEPNTSKLSRRDRGGSARGRDGKGSGDGDDGGGSKGYRSTRGARGKRGLKSSNAAKGKGGDSNSKGSGRGKGAFSVGKGRGKGRVVGSWSKGGKKGGKGGAASSDYDGDSSASGLVGKQKMVWKRK